MKTHTTKLLNKECLLVDNVEATYDNVMLFQSETAGYNMVGLLSELTDEDVEDLVELDLCKPIFDEVYTNYKDSRYVTFTPIESFFSALEAEGLFLNGNPYETVLNDLDVGLANLYHEAEARTFDKTRTLLLVKN